MIVIVSPALRGARSTIAHWSGVLVSTPTTIQSPAESGGNGGGDGGICGDGGGAGGAGDNGGAGGRSAVTTKRDGNGGLAVSDDDQYEI